MALTSEDVVEHGGQVVEQINKLSESMVVFQQRLGELSTGFDEMSQHVDQSESDVLESLARLEEATQSAWREEIAEMGETLIGSVKDPAIENIGTMQTNLETHYAAVSNTSVQLLDHLTDWQFGTVSTLMEQLEEAKGSNIASLESLTATASEDFEQLNTTMLAYENKVDENLEQLNNFIEGEISNPIADVYNDYNSRIEEFSSTMEEMMGTARQTLMDTQVNITEAMMNEVVEQFSTTIKSELIPLIDEMVDTVSDSIDDMLEKVIAIGDEAGDKSKALDAVTEMLEKLLAPIKDTIGRVQGIHDTVSAFL